MDFSFDVRALRVIHEIYARSARPRFVNEYSKAWQDDYRSSIAFGTGGLTSVGYAVAIGGRRMRIFIAGIEGPRMAYEVAAGYNSRRDMIEYEGFNIRFYADAKAIFDSVVKPDIGLVDDMEIYGHSAGGAIAEVLCKFVNNAKQPFPIRLATYGAPSPGFKGSWDTAQNVDRQRYMNLNDVVPGIPFTLTQDGNAAMVGMWGPAIMNPRDGRWPAFDCDQPVEGWAITHQYIRRQSIAWVTKPYIPAFREWISQADEGTEPHDAGTYLIVMRTLQAKYPDGFNEATTTPLPPVPHVPEINLVMPFTMAPTTTQNLVVPFELVGVSTSAGGSNGPPSLHHGERTEPGTLLMNGSPVGSFTRSESKMSALKIHSRYLAKAVKVGSSWQAVWNSTVILVADEPRTPKTFCKYLNRMLRNIGDTNTLWLDAFIATFTTMVGVYSTDATVCNPPMRVE